MKDSEGRRQKTGGRKKEEKKNIMHSYSTGFTLIEVVVAFAILSISFVLIMQLFSGGLKAAKTSCDYTRAVVLAKGKMDELSESTDNDSGEFEDGFKWELDVQLYKELEEDGVNLFKYKIKVSWEDVRNKQKSIDLVSLKAVSTDNEE
jgi:general secretion pathway protein I